MRVIEQEFDTPIEVREFNKLTELQQDGVFITCDKQGAKQLIEVLKELIEND